MGGVVCVRHQLGRQADADAGRRIDHHAPTEFLLVAVGGRHQRGALFGRQHAGDLGLIALLEVADGGFRGAAAGRFTGVVTRPIERRLDLLPFGERNGGEFGRWRGLGFGRRRLHHLLFRRSLDRLDGRWFGWRGLCRLRFHDCLAHDGMLLGCRCGLLHRAGRPDLLRLRARQAGAENEREQDDRGTATHCY